MYPSIYFSFTLYSTQCTKVSPPPQITAPNTYVKHMWISRSQSSYSDDITHMATPCELSLLWGYVETASAA